jgi:hypothetical protein
VRRPTCEHDPTNAGPPVYGPPTDPATLTDPWSETVTTTTAEIPRDRWGRPLVVPLGGGEPTAYTRVSTLAKALDDINNLMAWKARKAIEGVVRRPDLLTRAAGALANGDPDADWPTKKALNAVVNEATEAAGASQGASAGAGFHSLTEAIDRGDEPLFVPPADQPRLEAYREAMTGYRALDSELFVVNDQVLAAGSFDRLWLCPDGIVRVGDLKTGKSEADYPGATAIQLALYANASRYDPETGQRHPIHTQLDLTTALLIHMPPTGGCEVIPLDIAKGWRAAQLAAEVREIRAMKAHDWRVA